MCDEYTKLAENVQFFNKQVSGDYLFFIFDHHECTNHLIRLSWWLIMTDYYYLCTYKTAHDVT